MQSDEALFEPFAKRLDAFTVNPPSPVIGFDALPRDLQVLPLVDFVDERVNLSRPRRIDPVCESPRPMMFGSFTERTVYLTDLMRTDRYPALAAPAAPARSCPSSCLSRRPPAKPAHGLET